MALRNILDVRLADEDLGKIYRLLVNAQKKLNENEAEAQANQRQQVRRMQSNSQEHLGIKAKEDAKILHALGTALEAQGEKLVARAAELKSEARGYD